MPKLLMFISWTGWTKEQWDELLYKLTPIYWMSKTGWTKEEWIVQAKWATKTFCWAFVFWLIVWSIFVAFG